MIEATVLLFIGFVAGWVACNIWGRKPSGSVQPNGGGGPGEEGPKR